MSPAWHRQFLARATLKYRFSLRARVLAADRATSRHRLGLSQLLEQMLGLVDQHRTRIGKLVIVFLKLGRDISQNPVASRGVELAQDVGDQLGDLRIDAGGPLLGVADRNNRMNRLFERLAIHGAGQLQVNLVLSPCGQQSRLLFFAADFLQHRPNCVAERKKIVQSVGIIDVRIGKFDHGNLLWKS